MKSTSIESLIEEKAEPTVDINQPNDAVKNDDIQSELFDQLESLKSELSSIKNPPEEFKIQENSPVTDYKTEPYTNPSPPNLSNTTENFTEHKKTFFQNLYSLEKNDIKEIIILVILYLGITNPSINETIDNLIPYSLYSYNFVIKALIVVIIFRVLKVIEI